MVPFRCSPRPAGGRNAFESELRRLHVTQKNSTPNHPTTCGKVERFQQTMKKWLRAQPDQPTTITGLQTLIDRGGVTMSPRGSPLRANRTGTHRARQRVPAAGEIASVDSEHERRACA